MCQTLRKFYAALANKEGKSYSKSSIIGIRGALQRYLTGERVQRVVNIVTGPHFKAANDVLNGKLRKLKKDGLDVSKSHPPISDNDILKMYQSGTLSNLNPTSLQLKVYFEMCMHFGRRGREGLRDLTKNHFVFTRDDAGIEFVTLAFNPAEKNRQGEKVRDIEHDQRLYAVGGENCPLVSLRKYLNLLNPKCDAFFQRPKVENFSDSDVWYISAPVGVNKIAEFMKKISKMAKLSKTYTNHSIRSTTVTTLRNLGVHPNDIMSVTGHKSAQSILHYSNVSEDQRRNMSHLLAVKTGSSLPATSNALCPQRTKPSAALGAPIPTLPALPLPVTTNAKTTLTSMVSTPEKQTKVKITVTPNKLAMAIPQNNVFNCALIESPNKIPCSQTLAIPQNINQTRSDRVIAVRGMFAEHTSFDACTFNFY